MCNFIYFFCLNMKNISSKYRSGLIKTVILASFMSVLAFLPSKVRAQNIYLPENPKREVRAVWLTTISGLDWPRTRAVSKSGIERQKRELTDILDKLQKANINTVLLQTRIRGTVIYPSSFEPWDECLTGRPDGNPGYDPLAFAVDECHKRGMELHAWLVTVPLGKVALQKRYGSASVTRRRPELCRTFRGESFMVPGNESTASYVASLAAEIVKRYDVDGIHLDYIRYPEKSYGFSDDDLFRRSGADDKSEWRRENITRIVRAVHDSVVAVKPWVKLSSAPIGKYKDLSRYSSLGWNCLNAVYQDPQHWLSEGIQDMLFPMMYFLGDNFYPFLYDWKEGAGGRPVVPGLGIYFLDPREGRWSLSDVRQEMYAVRDAGIGGIALYRSDFFTRNCKGLYDMASSSFFSRPSLPPRMVWRGDTVAPAAPRGLDLSSSGILSWNGSTDAEDVVYNVYSSWQYPVDVSDGGNLCAIRLESKTFAVPESGLYYAVTAMDRFGNESEPCQLPASCVAFSSASMPYKLEGDTVRFTPDPQALCVYVKDLAGKTVRVALDDDFVVVSTLAPGWYKLVKMLQTGHSEPIGIFMK